MGQVHGSATTTPDVTATRPRSQASLAQLSRESGISSKTVAIPRSYTTLRCESGNRTDNMTARRITCGEVVTEQNGE